MIVIFLIIWNFWIFRAVHGISSNSTVEIWGQWEESWNGPSTGNPFIDVEMFVELKLENKKNTLTVRGFYDGSGTYRARFMPETLGTWLYKTRCNNKVLDNHTGSFLVIPPIMSDNHGPVIALPNGSTHFAYKDGSRYHVIGTTVYGLSGGWGSSKPSKNRTSQTIMTLSESPFNKVRMMAFPIYSGPADHLPYVKDPVSGNLDLTRFNPTFWQWLDRVIASLLKISVQADIILFNLYTPNYPKGLGCLGGPNASTYDVTPDRHFIRYIVSRLASFRNVWWSMSNEWSQSPCKWAGPDPNDTPIWDTLFKEVVSEDVSNHLLSIHNNAVLYNYSKPWITHFSIQHVHYRPNVLWATYGKKPFVWDEVKYEGNDVSNWGSLSAPQMMHKFWWAAATGAYATHGEVLNLNTSSCQFGKNSWSGNGGVLCGESPKRIAWFYNYIMNTSIHPPFENCSGDDDGYVQTLTCGTSFILFRFYHGVPFCNSSFRTVDLPIGIKYRQELVDPWAMRISNIWPPEQSHDNIIHVDHSSKKTGTKPVGITVDDDTLPHILTFRQIP